MANQNARKYDPICSIEGCNHKHNAKGLCNTHYYRLQRHGDPHYVSYTHGCKVDGCEEKHRSLGYCHKHYQNFKRHGQPISPNHSWGEINAYKTMHNHLTRTLGPAREQDCFFGFHPADEWAFLKELCDDPKEGTDGPWSDQVEHYAPVCTQHHRQMDGLFDKRDGLGLAGIWNEMTIEEIPGEVIA